MMLFDIFVVFDLEVVVVVVRRRRSRRRERAASDEVERRVGVVVLSELN